MKGLLFTYGLTYGGAVVSLFNPFYGLLIYICFAIVRPESMWYWSVPAGNYSRIVAIALLLGWAINGFGNWRFGRAKPVVFAFIGFWLWAAASAMQASNQEVAFGFLESMAKILLPFLVGITLIDSIPKLKTLAWVIVLSQGYVALEMNLSYYSGFNRVQLIGFGGMDNNCVAIAMVAGFGMTLFLGILSDKWYLKILGVVMAILMAHTIMFAFSRGGMLALIITGMVAFVLIPKTTKHYLFLFLAVALCLRLAGPEVQERFFTAFADKEERDASAQSRMEMWGQCIDVMKENPIFGIGPDHWPLIASRWGWGGVKEAHTLWLQTGAELGFVGLLCLLYFYGSCIIRLWPYRRDGIHADPWFQTAARMVIASIVGFTVAAQFVSLEGLELPYYVALVGAGALKLASAPETASTGSEVPAESHRSTHHARAFEPVSAGS